MRKLSIWSLFMMLSLALVACTAQQITSTLNSLSKTGTGDNPLTNDEIIQGLKEALIQGISKGSDQASAADGFFKNPTLKLLWPPDAVKAEQKLRAIGLGNKVDQFIETLNRGAEASAKQAKTIFVDAIKQMSISDAVNILKGEKNAATVYLKKTTEAKLLTAFKPVMQKCLDNVSATKYYDDLINTYNKIPTVEKVNPDLNAYASQKAVDGLFILIEKEEKEIRDNPAARTTDILKKVFAQATK